MKTKPTPNLLEQVATELQKREGELRKVAGESGINYDTLLRIKNRENDPGYTKVHALHNYLFSSAAA